MARFPENRFRQNGFLENRGHRFVWALLVALLLVLDLGLMQGCSRSESLQSSPVSSSATAQKLPFHSDIDQAEASDGTAPARASDPKPAASVPFASGSQPRTLPAGTLFPVQLGDSLYTAKARAGDTFTASVATPVAIDREVLVQAGTVVSGRVESARSLAEPSNSIPGSGYFQLSLTSITVSGKEVPLQTASLFARGTFRSSSGVGVRKGYRLTFRLTAPVTLDSPSSVANRQPLSSAGQ